MNHDEAIGLAIRDLDAPLPTDRRAALNEHLVSCEQCRGDISTLRAAHDALTSWGAEAAPPPVETAAPTRAAPPIGRRQPWPTLIAATLVGLLLGVAGGYSVARNAAGSVEGQLASRGSGGRQTFALLLEERADSWPPASPLMRPGYFEWRDSLMARDAFVGGERFAEDAGWYVAQGGAAAQMGARGAAARPPANFSGLFLVRARSYEEAVAIARESPHVRYGGILVRRSDTP